MQNAKCKFKFDWRWKSEPKKRDENQRENGKALKSYTFNAEFLCFPLELLTAKERIVTKNAQAAKNHCTLHISFPIAFDVSSNPASKTMQDVGIKILDTNKSANATLTINALPGNNRGIFFDSKTF